MVRSEEGGDSGEGVRRVVTVVRSEEGVTVVRE